MRTPGGLFALASMIAVPTESIADCDYPALEKAGSEETGHARTALGIRLFVGVSEGRFEPVHRQIAEFLAAQYVARRIGIEFRYSCDDAGTHRNRADGL